MHLPQGEQPEAGRETPLRHPQPPRSEPGIGMKPTFEERMQAASMTRREPRVSDGGAGPARGAPSPLRPTPRLGQPERE